MRVQVMDPLQALFLFCSLSAFFSVQSRNFIALIANVHFFTAIGQHHLVLLLSLFLRMASRRVPDSVFVCHAIELITSNNNNDNGNIDDDQASFCSLI